MVKLPLALPQFRQKVQLRLTLVLLMLFCMTVFSTLGFMVIEDIPPFDAFYLAVVTFTTVGYGDMVPSTFNGRLFAVATIFLGLLGSGISIAIFADIFFENTIIELLRGRKMEKRILTFKDHYIICGFGVTGSCIAKSLLASGNQVVIIEQEELELEEHPKLLFIHGDARKDDVLHRSGISRAKGLAATLTSDADNVFVVLTARSINYELEIVSRFKDDDTEKKLIAAGANNAISPYRMGGHRLYLALTAPMMASMVDDVLQHTLPSVTFSEVTLPDDYKQDCMTLTKARDMACEEGILLVAAFKPNGQLLFNPPGTQACVEVDRLLVLGELEKNMAFGARLKA